MARLTIVVLAFVAAPLAGCLDFSVPQRNIQAVSHDVIPVSDAMQRLETDNPNRARVGSQFRIRIFRDGQQEPVHTATEHVYNPPQMRGVHNIDLTPYCGDAPDTCGEYRAHAVLLDTYWLANE